MRCLYVGQIEDFGYAAEVLEQRKGILEATGTISHIEDTTNRVLSDTYDVVAYDLTMFLDPPYQIIHEIIATRNVNQAKVILVAPGYGHNSEIIAACLEKGFCNFILDATYGRQKETFERCLNGYFEANAGTLKEVLPKEKENRGLTFVGFAGTQSRIGTTTQALQFAKYVTYLGYRACYVEVNGQGIAEKIYNLYQSAKKVGEHVVYQGVPMYPVLPMAEMMKMPYDFLILDYGSITSGEFQQMGYLGEKMKRVLVAGVKPDELLYTHQAIDTAHYADAHFIFSFVAESDVDEIYDMMEDRKEHVSFASYTPDPFAYKVKSNGIYEKIVQLKPAGRKRRLFGRKRKGRA